MEGVVWGDWFRGDVVALNMAHSVRQFMSAYG